MLGELALPPPYLLAEVAAAAGEIPVPVQALNRDRRARLVEDHVRTERFRPALLDRHLLADEQVAIDLGEKLGQCVRDLGPILVATDRGEPVSRPVTKQPRHPDTGLATGDEREQSGR